MWTEHRGLLANPIVASDSVSWEAGQAPTALVDKSVHLDEQALPGATVLLERPDLGPR